MNEPRVKLLISHVIPDEFDPAFETFYTRINKLEHYIRQMFNVKTQYRMHIKNDGDDSKAYATIECIIPVNDGKAAKQKIHDICRYVRAISYDGVGLATVGREEYMAMLN